MMFYLKGHQNCRKLKLKVPKNSPFINTMGPFKLSSNQLISELGISLLIAYGQSRNAIWFFNGF